MADDDHAATWADFNEAVNMTPAALKKHLDSEASKEVGQKKGGGESTGHAMGRRILAIKDTKKADLTDDDYAAMRKVVATSTAISSRAERPGRTPTHRGGCR